MDRAEIREVVENAQTVAQRHGTYTSVLRGGGSWVYADVRLKISVCLEPGITDCLISSRGADSTWSAVLVWTAYQIDQPGVAVLFRRGAWTEYVRRLSGCHTAGMLAWRVARWHEAGGFFLDDPPVDDMRIEKVWPAPEQEIFIATDGSWREPVNEGGWAYIVRHGREERIGFGRTEGGDSHHVEIKAIVEALRCCYGLGLLTGRARITILTDYEGAVRRLSGAGPRQKPQGGWRQARKRVPYAAMFDEIATLLGSHTVSLIWTGGRRRIPDKTRVHNLSRLAAGIVTQAGLKAARMTAEEWEETFNATSRQRTPSTIPSTETPTGSATTPTASSAPSCSATSRS